jgi:hypothetical protein
MKGVQLRTIGIRWQRELASDQCTEARLHRHDAIGMGPPGAEIGLAGRKRG